MVFLRSISQTGVSTLLGHTLVTGYRTKVPLCAKLGLEPGSEAEKEFCRRLQNMVAGVPALLVSALKGCVEAGVAWGDIPLGRMAELLAVKQAPISMPLEKVVSCCVSCVMPRKWPQLLTTP